MHSIATPESALACNLDLRLRGVARSTARDATRHDFRAVLVRDGSAALTDADRDATLGNMASPFADVMGTDEVFAALPAQTPAHSRRAA